MCRNALLLLLLYMYEIKKNKTWNQIFQNYHFRSVVIDWIKR